MCRDGLVVVHCCWLLGLDTCGILGVMGFISGASFPLVHKLVKTQFLSGLEIFFSKSVKIVVCKIPKTHLGFGKGFFGLVFRIY